MLREIIDAISRALKDNFKDKKVWEYPVDKGYTDGDFVLKLEKTATAPKPSGYIFHTLTFILECRYLRNGGFYDLLIPLETAIDVIELESGIMLRANIIENKIDDDKLTFEFSYSFYSMSGQDNSEDMMEGLEIE
ncbi:MAG: hypothetical protein R3Y33_08905 [Clostridia bacterium]